MNFKVNVFLFHILSVEFFKCVGHKSSSFGFFAMAPDCYRDWVAKNQMCLIGVGLALQVTVGDMLRAGFIA